MNLRLDRKYERTIKGDRFIKFSILSGTFVALFLLIFQPFGLFSLKHSYKTLIIIGFGFVTTGTLLLTYLVHDYWLNRKISTVGQHLFSLFFRTFLIGIFNVIYAMGIGLIELSLNSILWFLWITFAVGIFPVIGFIAYDYLKNLFPFKSKKEYIQLVSENKKERIKVDISELLFIRSSDNYCEILCSKKQIKKALIRGSLKDFEAQINHPNVIRTHRSYIVNISNVVDYSGNSQGMNLYYKDNDVKALVSRRYVNRVKELLENVDMEHKHFTTQNTEVNKE